MILEGQLANDKENSAVLILEKMPFDKEKSQELLRKSSLKTEFKNDIYGKYECFVEPSLNSLKANLIYPATEKHINKYKSSNSYIINETAALHHVRTFSFMIHFATQLLKSKF